MLTSFAVQVQTALLLVLVTGSVADKFSRRTIMSVTLALMGVCALGLFAVTGAGIATNWMIFVIIALFGTTRAFYNPARQSLVPNIVPTSHLPPRSPAMPSCSRICAMSSV